MNHPTSRGEIEAQIVKVGRNVRWVLIVVLAFGFIGLGTVYGVSLSLKGQVSPWQKEIDDLKKWKTDFLSEFSQYHQVDTNIHQSLNARIKRLEDAATSSN